MWAAKGKEGQKKRGMKKEHANGKIQEEKFHLAGKKNFRKRKNLRLSNRTLESEDFGTKHIVC